jgi:hypothetical protein
LKVVLALDELNFCRKTHDEDWHLDLNLRYARKKHACVLTPVFPQAQRLVGCQTPEHGAEAPCYQYHTPTGLKRRRCHPSGVAAIYFNLNFQLKLSAKPARARLKWW